MREKAMGATAERYAKDDGQQLQLATEGGVNSPASNDKEKDYKVSFYYFVFVGEQWV